MAAVTICSDFGTRENKSLSLFPLFPSSIFHEVMGLAAMILVFWMLNFQSEKPTFPLSSFTLIKISYTTFYLPILLQLGNCIGYNFLLL